MHPSRSFALVGALACVAVLAGPAFADEPGDAEPDRATIDGLRAAGDLAMVAIQGGDRRGVMGAMAAEVDYWLPARRCGKAFRRSGSATGRKRDAVAACLIKLGKGGFTRDVTVLPRRRRIHVRTGDGYFLFDLTAGDAPVVAGVRYIDAASKDVSAFSPLHEPDRPPGEPGGVVDGLLRPPPPPPPPPAGGAGEQLLVGDPRILPDDAAREAIARSGTHGFVVLVKVCFDPAGAVTDVTMLQSSGVPAYDEQIRRTIRGWRYRPHVVDDKPTRACTVVNLTYRG